MCSLWFCDQTGKQLLSCEDSRKLRKLEKEDDTNGLRNMMRMTIGWEDDCSKCA